MTGVQTCALPIFIADGIVFYDNVVLLGTKGINQTEKELRLVGYVLTAMITGSPPTDTT